MAATEYRASLGLRLTKTTGFSSNTLSKFAKRIPQPLNHIRDLTLSPFRIVGPASGEYVDLARYRITRLGQLLDVRRSLLFHSSVHWARSWPVSDWSQNLCRFALRLAHGARLNAGLFL